MHENNEMLKWTIKIEVKQLILSIEMKNSF